ncbi:MAG: hypothetical protein M0P50_06275 [Bacteroidales bacterium]|jgi:hypothetical protein|nr:hypothetical protein [Bacteroidales bacterium]
MTESYEIKNSRNCTIHAKCDSNSAVLLYIQGISNKAKADTHLSTFGFCRNTSRHEKPKELKFEPNAQKHETESMNKKIKYKKHEKQNYLFLILVDTLDYSRI